MNTYEARVKPLAYCFGRQTIRLPHWLTLVVTAALVFGLVYQMEKLVISATPSEATKQPAVQRARMSDEISVHAAGRGNPWINLSDGHELITPYSGPAELTQILERNEARPLSLCSADFDEDGVPDLISGYAGPSGGIVTLLRGNVDSIYPNAPEAQQRKAEGTFTDAPFLSPVFVFGVPEPADFIGAGDFDGDSHWDVVTAARGSSKLSLMSGDGKGGLREIKRIDLPGGVTAMVVGEINRRDGLDDIVVGVSGQQGPKAVVFEGPQGALKASPETFDLPKEATSLALGQLDDNYEMDLAIAAGHDLMVLHGRDRKLSLPDELRFDVPAVRMSRQTFPFRLRAVISGNFGGDSEYELAVEGDDGFLRVLSDRASNAPVQDPAAVTDEPRLETVSGRVRFDRVQTGGNRGAAVSRSSEWSVVKTQPCPASRLFKARLSTSANEQLMGVDSSHDFISILPSAAVDDALGTSDVTGETQVPSETMELEAASMPIAVLPMRLNADALSDLVVLTQNRAAVTVLVTRAQATFTVRNTNDSGAGSLRQAILDANSSPGADVITFAIGSGEKTINLLSQLPAATEAVTIDGTTQPGFTGKPAIEIRFAVEEGVGFVVSGGNSIVRGLAIVRRIQFATIGNDVLEGCYVGTDISGRIDENDGGFSGVFINSCADNVVGGTVSQARNVISGNAICVYVGGRPSTRNRITGNFVGVDATGLGVLINRSERNGFGIVLQAGPVNNTIGGTVNGARNVISGIDMLGSQGAVWIISGNAADETTTGNVVQGNFIGPDAAGGRLNSPSFFSNLIAVNIAQGPGTTIGGTISTARNVISGNFDGVTFGGNIGTGPTSDVLIQGNFIGTDPSGVGALPNGTGVDSGAGSIRNRVEGNVIAFNFGDGISLPRLVEGFSRFVSIVGNSIASNGDQAIDLNNDGPTVNDDRDPDVGANDLQNFPALTSARTLSKPSKPGDVTPAALTTVSGVFNSTPNATFTLQFFFGSNCSGSGHQFTGAIPIPLQPTLQVTTDVNGNAPFSYAFNFPTASTSGFVNSTATSATGNTSEVSECIAVTNAIPLRITGACKGDGKQLIINGSGFVEGGKAFLNGEAEKTQFVSSSQVIAFKAGKRAQTGDTLKVRNPDASETPQITYTRVNCSAGGTQTEELLTDDGTAETFANNVSLLLVNRLTPSSYPATLLRIRIDFRQFQGQPSPVGQRIRLVAFMDPSGSGQPPSFPALLVDQSAVIPQDGGFVDFPVVGPTITAGDLYVGFQAPNPANGVFFSADTNGPQRQRAFQSTDNGLTFIGPVGFGSGSDFQFANFLIRAVVSKGG
jgi:hypothetical protein